MMDYGSFISIVTADRRILLPECLQDAGIQFIGKADTENGHDELRISAGNGKHFGINMEQLYEDCCRRSMSEVIGHLKKDLEDLYLKISHIDVPRQDFDEIYREYGKNIMIRCLNTDYAAPVLKSCPHAAFHDIGILPVSVPSNRNDADVLQNEIFFTLPLLRVWKKPLEEIITDAIHNTCEKYPEMFIPLNGMIPDIPAPYVKLISDLPCWLLTSGYPGCGCSAVFYPGVPEMITEETGNCFLIPASYNGWLVTPMEGIPGPAGLKKLLQDANELRSPEEVLSENVYACGSGEVWAVR